MFVSVSETIAMFLFMILFVVVTFELFLVNRGLKIFIIISFSLIALILLKTLSNDFFGLSWVSPLFASLPFSEI